MRQHPPALLLTSAPRRAHSTRSQNACQSDPSRIACPALGGRRQRAASLWLRPPARPFSMEPAGSGSGRRTRPGSAMIPGPFLIHPDANRPRSLGQLVPLPCWNQGNSVAHATKVYWPLRRQVPRWRRRVGFKGSRLTTLSKPCSLGNKVHRIQCPYMASHSSYQAGTARSVAWFLGGSTSLAPSDLRDLGTKVYCRLASRVYWQLVRSISSDLQDPGMLLPMTTRFQARAAPLEPSRASMPPIGLVAWSIVVV